MKKSWKRLVAVAATCVMASTMTAGLAACGSDGTGVGEYTFRDYTTSLATNWNPHTWEGNTDSALLEYISSPFVDMSIKNSETMEYQWVYEMATAVTDTTKDHISDLTKYNSAGANAETPPTEGYVFDIALNRNAKWENGESITADDYVYSMQQLLNPKMRNYRANLYYSGESAIAGALEYYNSETPIYDPIVPAYGDDEEPDYSFDITSKPVYLHLTEAMTVTPYSFVDLRDLGYVDGALYNDVSKKANAYGYIVYDDTTKGIIHEIVDQYLSAFSMSIYTDEGKTQIDVDLLKEFLFYNTGRFGEKVSYDKVGLYKVDDYTIRYVLKTMQKRDYFLTSLTSTWLVYEDLYESNKDTTGELTTTKYGTSKDTTMSYGVYKLESMQKEKQMVLVQNENWYGFEKKGDKLVSYTNFLVDGEKKEQYKTKKIIIDVMDQATAKEKFLKGELSNWTPAADEMSTYSTSDKIYQVDETYTMSFFFNSSLSALQNMDKNKGNTNSVVLSNDKFRKAFSLSINRADWVKATAGFKPAYSLMSKLYYYNAFEDPTSIYRDTEPAMKAICDLYGVEYGEGKPYATLKEAHDSITGYNLTEAKALMKEACDELVAAGLYKKGENIHIRVAYGYGALTSDNQQQMTLFNQYLNAALEGSGFGKITLEALGNLGDERYDGPAKGEYAIGYGAWGGAAFYPFRNLQVYFDPDQNKVNELGCWDPKTTNITLNINGQEDTMTAQAWANCMIGEGKYANSPDEVKIEITAQLENWFLKTYYRIPIASTTGCSLLSYQVDYYTENYNIMYAFGGIRLLNYNYDDAEWNKYVKDHNGILSYV